jgi:hypothetical protein
MPSFLLLAILFFPFSSNTLSFIPFTLLPTHFNDDPKKADSAIATTCRLMIFSFRRLRVGERTLPLSIRWGSEK